MAPRVLLAMSRDRLLPAALQTVNRGGTPTVAHWTTIGVVAGFILSGTVNSVLALCAFFFVFNYTLSFVSVFALRRKEPETPRPFRVPGFPFTTGLALEPQLEVDGAAGAQLSGVSRARKTSARNHRGHGEQHREFLIEEFSSVL
jgi:APA family basic amino acid/polyamine antiporter